MTLNFKMTSSKTKKGFRKMLENVKRIKNYNTILYLGSTTDC